MNDEIIEALEAFVSVLKEETSSQEDAIERIEKGAIVRVTFEVADDVKALKVLSKIEKNQSIKMLEVKGV